MVAYSLSAKTVSPPERPAILMVEAIMGVRGLRASITISDVSSGDEGSLLTAIA